MGYKRNIQPARVRFGEELVSDMVGIGMLLPAEPNLEANIEDTLLFASRRALEDADRDTLSLLVSWLEVHFPWLNADRLTRLISTQESELVRAFWLEFARRRAKDQRFRKLTRLRARRSLVADLLEELPDRSADILEPGALAAMHDGYRHRVRMGPSYRADMWAVLSAEPGLSASELARRTYGSFATAWQVKRDWRIVTGER